MKKKKYFLKPEVIKKFSSDLVLIETSIQEILLEIVEEPIFFEAIPPIIEALKSVVDTRLALNKKSNRKKRNGQHNRKKTI